MYRRAKITSLIHQELSRVILTDFDFGGALATITTVDLNDKLDYAKIGVSIIPPSKESSVVKTLSNAAKTIEWRLVKKLNLRPVPRLSFFADQGLLNSAKVEKLLKDK